MSRRYVQRPELLSARRVAQAAHEQLEEVKALIPGLEDNRATTAVAARLREILNMRKVD